MDGRWETGADGVSSSQPGPGMRGGVMGGQGVIIQTHDQRMPTLRKEILVNLSLLILILRIIHGKVFSLQIYKILNVKNFLSLLLATRNQKSHLIYIALKLILLKLSFPYP